MSTLCVLLLNDATKTLLHLHAWLFPSLFRIMNTAIRYNLHTYPRTIDDVVLQFMPYCILNN
jgi:hypothetical protein